MLVTEETKCPTFSEMDEVYTDLFMSLQGLEYFFVIRQNDSLAQSLCAGIVVKFSLASTAQLHPCIFRVVLQLGG